MKKINKNNDVKKQMLEDAILIIQSVEMYGKRYEEIILEIDEAYNNKDHKRLQELEKEIHYLDKKISEEDEAMKKFKLKYKNLEFK